MKSLLPENELNAWKALLNAQAVAVGAIEAHLAERDQIPLTWYDVLWSLRKSDGGRLRFRLLQDEIVLSRSALSRVVDALAKEGLVKKRACAEDDRGLDVELTDKGRKALAAAWPIYSEGVAQFFSSHLSADDCTRLTAILGKVVA
jgi:DNA-binding MarR family transcriptional regulator